MVLKRAISGDFVVLFFMVLAALYVCYLLYSATVWGAGLTADSIAYLEGARDIIEDGNLDGIGTHFPPLYFLIIAFCGGISGDPLASLRYIQIVVIGLNLLAGALIVWKATHRSFLSTIIFLLVFVTSQPILSLHAMAWSEAMFSLFALLGVYYLLRFIHNSENRNFTLILSALCLSGAFLTRYAGITLIMTGVISLLLFSGTNVLKRVKTSLLYGFISCLPMFLWMLRNWYISDNVTSRRLGYHPISTEKIEAGIQVFLQGFFIPENNSIVFLLLLFLVILLYIFTAKINPGDIERYDRTPEICFIFIVIYIPFIVVSISFFDAHTPLSPRILFPAYLFFLMAIIVLNNRAVQTHDIKTIGIALSVLLIIFSLAQQKVQTRYLAYAKAQGLGFASKGWRQSETLKWVTALPKNTVIYTNAPDAIKVHTDRSSEMIPHIVVPTSRNRNQNLVADMQNMVQDLSQNDGVIVYFHGITWRWYLPTLEQLEKGLSLHYVFKGSDGVVAQVKTSSD